MTSNSEYHEANPESDSMTVDDGCRIIRCATIDDLDALVTLEESCFAEPWSRKNFEAELEGNQFSRVLMIAHPEQANDVQAIGYLCMWIVFEEMRFLNVAVHQDFRRQGVAKQLIQEALRQGRDDGCCRGMLEVRATNMPAQILYKSFCFQSYATRKSYYTNPTEDAILMSLEPLSPISEERRHDRGKPVGSQATIHTNS